MGGICRAVGKTRGAHDGKQSAASTCPCAAGRLSTTFSGCSVFVQGAAEQSGVGWGFWVLQYEYLIVIRLFVLTAGWKV